MTEKTALLNVEKLNIAHGRVPIVRDISFELSSGEALGIVGESGCGKTTMLRSLMALKKDSTSYDGSINFLGNDLTKLPEEKLRQLRGGEIAMIPQNAFLAMDATKTISSLFYETVCVHRRGVKRAETDADAALLMKKLLLQDPERILRSYPFELSGGMCQRVMIAVAMINSPKLLLGDEPTSALDVSSQMQVVEQLKLLRDGFSVSIVIVSHNLGVIAQLTDKVAVMYAGRIVEYGSTRDVIDNPEHPYTRALIAAIPNINGEISDGLAGTPPVFTNDMRGCPFAQRCPEANSVCDEAFPAASILTKTHSVCCHTTAINWRQS